MAYGGAATTRSRAGIPLPPSGGCKLTLDITEDSGNLHRLIGRLHRTRFETGNLDQHLQYLTHASE